MRSLGPSDDLATTMPVGRTGDSEQEESRNGILQGYRTPERRVGMGEVVSSLNQMRRNILHCVEGLSDEQAWLRIVPDVSAVGNLLMHLRGTEHQWIGHKIGKKALHRDREREFSARRGIGLSTLVEGLRTVAKETKEILGELDEAKVNEYRSEDGFSIPFILHYTNQHFAVHLGQLVVLREYLSPRFRLY